ncbi:murein hydrolase activator EnvC [Streptomyces sp. XD-27]|uniref:murein hydrolase activator EnvC family protein n=1 Tax=Streptomyces sp. XD-27 TaxID=3062779 RepID=UPI0026F46843|nr:M23 family metallopeptidase [Streptomyces sp. XD-27]WKX74469.1 M23 family metallopeptidase [Streptomyces sp. XD-27]
MGGAAPAAADDRSAPDRAWPVGGTRPAVLRGWAPPASDYGPGHRGVDLAAAPGETVRAAAPGTVAFAGQVAGRGVVSILLGPPRSDGREAPPSGRPDLRITYEPVRPMVRKGDRVAAGQPVGVLGSGPFHCSAGCLHWGLRRGDRYLDPLSLLPPSMLRRGPSRLLPVFGVPERPEQSAAAPPLPVRDVSGARPAGWLGLVPVATLTAASSWARLRLSAGPREPRERGGRRVGRARRLSRARRAGPWRRPPR